MAHIIYDLKSSSCGYNSKTSRIKVAGPRCGWTRAALSALVMSSSSIYRNTLYHTCGGGWLEFEGCCCCCWGFGEYWGDPCISASWFGVNLTLIPLCALSRRPGSYRIFSCEYNKNWICNKNVFVTHFFSEMLSVL